MLSCGLVLSIWCKCFLLEFCCFVVSWLVSGGSLGCSVFCFLGGGCVYLFVVYWFELGFGLLASGFVLGGVVAFY